PSNWKLITCAVGIATMKISAPNLTTNEVILATLASCLSLLWGLIYSLKMLRVNRLAAAIDITAAGTNAPMAIAAKAKPANQSGKEVLIKMGTAAFAPKFFRKLF